MNKLVVQLSSHDAAARMAHCTNLYNRVDVYGERVTHVISEWNQIYQVTGLRTVENQKLWQQAKHARQCPGLCQAGKRKPLTAQNSMQRKQFLHLQYTIETLPNWRNPSCGREVPRTGHQSWVMMFWSPRWCTSRRGNAQVAVCDFSCGWLPHQLDWEQSLIWRWGESHQLRAGSARTVHQQVSDQLHVGSSRTIHQQVSDQLRAGLAT